MAMHMHILLRVEGDADKLADLIDKAGYIYVVDPDLDEQQFVVTVREVREVRED